MSDKDREREEKIAERLHRDLFVISWKRHCWLQCHGKADDWIYQRKRLHMLRQWFELLDADGSGEVGVDELADPLISLGLAKNRQDLQRLIQSVDKNQSGEISFEEFLVMMDEKKSKPSSASSPVDNDVSNPVIQLYNTIMSGGIGDVNLLSLSYLLSAYSRKMFLAAYISSDLELQQYVLMIHNPSSRVR